MNNLQNILEQLGKLTPGSQPTLYTWVYDNGIPFDSIALTRREWNQALEACVYQTPRECFANCQQTVLEPSFLHIPEIARGDLGFLSPFSYVEGYVIDQRFPIPIHHAWLLLNGKVIDPTLRLHPPYRRKRLPDRVMGRFPRAREYYGVVIPWKNVAGCVVANMSWHCLLDEYKYNFIRLQQEEESGTRDRKEM